MNRLLNRRPVELALGIPAMLRAQWQLRTASSVGSFARVFGGRVRVENAGRLELGGRARFLAQDGVITLRTSSAGHLKTGSGFSVNFGSEIRASGDVLIGDNVSLGPRCIVGDSLGDPRLVDVERAEGIVIEDGVWLASRVMVLPGARIGAGSVVAAGSVVDSVVPPGVVVGGTPARVLRRLSTDGADAPAESAVVTPDTVTTDIVTAAPEQRGACREELPLVRAVLISDFTVDPLAHWLRKCTTSQRFDVDVAPFGAVVPSILAPPVTDPDVVVVWTRPEAVLPSIADVMAGAQTDIEAVTADVDALVGLIERGLAAAGAVFVTTWAMPPWERGLGVADLRPGGLRHAIRAANERLIARLADSSNAVVLDIVPWLVSSRLGGFDRRGWLRGKIPFADDVFEAAASEVADGALTRRQAGRKLIVVDLDDTMWGGIVGDDGWERLRLGGHDPAGEAFVEFQKVLKRLRAQGILLGVASKNEESVALEAIDEHPEMVLRRDDFVAWRINWSDKAANIADMAAALNLGLQSVVFIDDNPRERARVREALPEVLVPEWPADPTDYAPALSALRCFDLWRMTEEDRARAAMYAEEAHRSSLLADVADLDAWLDELGVVVNVAPLSAANLTRAAQLLNKTNQLNLRTRRLSEQELRDWAAAEAHETWCISVSDRLGDSGLTGILSLRHHDGCTDVEDYVLSCRVMGRRIEETLLHLASEAAMAGGSTLVRAELIDTPKNKPTRRVLEEADLENHGGNAFSFPAGGVAVPDSIVIEWDR